MSRPSDTIVQTSAGGMFTSLPRSAPTQVYVLVYKDGSARTFAAAPTISNRFGSRGGYLVETAPRCTFGMFEVPASDDGFEFHVQVEITWQVTDPELVVRNRVENGADLVLRHVGDLVWT